MSWLEQKYILLLSNRLERFKRKSGSLFNFRCPVCMDSHKSKSKSRGYLYDEKGSYKFYCHNCHASMKFPSFLKMLDSGLYDLFVKEQLLEKYGDKTKKDDIQQFVEKLKTKSYIKDTALKDLKKVSQLPTNHKVKKYIVERQIPNKYHAEMFYCPTFKAWTNQWIPGKFNEEYEEERIIIPLLDKDDKLFGYQGRLIGPVSDKQLRYVTIILNELSPRLWGLKHVDFNKKFYILEGPLDAMCLDNAIATCGGKITSELNKLNCNQENGVVIYDNEPRNKAVVDSIRSAIQSNFKVCIWPDHIKSKDVNDMMLKEKYSAEQLMKLIDDNTFKGPAALLSLNKWSKI